MDPHSHVPNRLFVVISSIIGGAVAGLVLVGWALDITILRSFAPGHSEMQPVTAVAFLLAAVALALASVGRREFRFASAALGVLITLVAAAMLCVYISGSTAFTSSFFLPHIQPGAAGGNRMSPHSAVNFLLIGFALVAANLGGRLRRIGTFLALGSVVGAYAALLGHLYHADRLYGMSTVNGMSVPAAFSFAVVASAIIAMDPGCRIVRLVVGDSLGSHAARRLLPVVVLLPTLIGWLRVMGQDAGMFDTGLGSAMSILTMVLLMLVIIIYYSQTVHNSDIDRKHAEGELKEKEKRYRELFDYSRGMICIHDLEGRIETVNPAVLRSLGYDREEVLGRSLFDFIPEDERAGFPAFLREIENEGLSTGLLPLIAKDGSRVIWRYTSILVSDPPREPYVIGHAQDVSELIAAQKQLRELSLKDDLTGLYNRRGFLTLAEQQLRLESHQGTARGLTLLFADMDGLKTINDRFGHDAGSEAIIALADVLRSALRGADLIARWGGDEFVMLLIGSKGENADLTLERIRRRIDDHNATSGKPYEIACSIGSASITHDDALSLDELIARADEAMYRDKADRKARRPAAGALPVQLLATPTGVAGR
jgi:diguanylate cyclase (GGDEF)-like protein/PAS domain S-box-containing protein